MTRVLAWRESDCAPVRWLRWALAYGGGFVGAMLDQRRRR